MKGIVLIIALLSLNLRAQEVVDVKNFDEELFREQLLAEVNKLRKRNRQDSLQHDPSLDQAAADHAAYMTENKTLSHQQKNKLKQAPIDRVKFYGGSHAKVAENTQLFPLAYEVEKSKGRLTYEKLAREVVGNWKKSSGHYKNMINGDYTGVAHQFTLKDGQLYCCQLLASSPFIERHDFQKGEEMFVKDKNPCWNCKWFRKKSDKNQAHLGWYKVSNDSIYYLNTNLVVDNKNKIRKGNLKKVFSGRGAIAIDVIHHEQYNCSGNPAFHNALHHDGYYLGYVSKASFKQDLDPDPNQLKLFVGMKPAFADTFFQVDFNLIKRWRPCMHGMTIYVHPDFLEPSEYFEIPRATIREQSIVMTDSIEVKIPFESGQTNEDTTIFHPLLTTLDSLVKEKFSIRSIYFTGVASIEGTEEGNQLLFKKRGEIIREYLKRYYPNFELKSEFYENFDDFRSGLLSIGVENAISMSEDSLRLYANLNRKRSDISDLLDESRYSSVRIIYEDVIPIEMGGYGLSVARLQELIDEKEYREMEPLYEYLAHEVMKGTIDQKDSLITLQIPDKSEYKKLHWYDFVFRLTMDTSYKVTAAELNQLKEVGAIPTTADYLEYRLLFNVFNGNETIDVSDFGEIFSEMRVKRQKAWVECLELISGVQNYRYSQQMAVPILVERTLKKKFDVKKTYFICQYLIMWGYTAEPYILLSKFARRPGQFSKLYKQYLKLGYFLGQFNIEKEWKRIRIVMKRFAEEYPQDFCELFKWNQMGVRALNKVEIAELFCEYCREEEQE
ncbi:MAG: CAP domain-containing protein [Crocinitomicaceae bacterium]